MKSLRIVLAGVAAASLGALIPNIAAADAPQAIGIAATHAGLAANVGNINQVHLHLHHVLNCLVGPGGDGFDQMAGNPCGMAGGAIPQENNAEMKTKLLNYATAARSGIGEGNMADAKKIATDIQSGLQAK